MNTPGKSKLTPAGNIIRVLRIARFWHDGDGSSFLWNLWNPLSYPCIVLMFVGMILAYGASSLKEFPGLTLSKYWKQHKNEREFF